MNAGRARHTRERERENELWLLRAKGLERTGSAFRGCRVELRM